MVISRSGRLIGIILIVVGTLACLGGSAVSYTSTRSVESNAAGGFVLGVVLSVLIAVPFVGAGIYLGVQLVYDIGFWLLAGQTPGKRVLGVRIVRTDGKRLRFWNALRRVIGYVFSSILFLGYLWILFDNRRQGFHDKLAGTMVVYSWPEDELKGTFVRDKVEHIRHRRRAKRESEGTGS